MPNNIRAHRHCALALTFALFFVPFPANAGRQEAAKESLEQLQSRIESLKKEMEKTEGAHADAADALKQSELAISEANRKLYALDQQHRENRSTLQALQAQKSGLEQTISGQQRLLGEQLYRQYLNSQQSYLKIVLTEHDPAAISRDLYYLSYVARARADQIASLRKNLEQVAVLNEKTASTLAQIAALKAEQESQRKELQTQQKTRRNVLGKLSAQIKSQRGEIAKLKRDEKRLSNLVEQLARIVPKAPKARPASREKSRINDTVPTADLDGSSFASLKGKLRLPVRGEIANRFGAPREDSGISWKGLFIRSSEGTEVKSVAGGRVVFADWLRGFGNLLIVDHGDGYMSLYGNNQALLKKTGEEVSAGDTLATVGNSGGNPESGLYFELRRQSKPFDPLSWSIAR
jgi:murein hydrolase activator